MFRFVTTSKNKMKHSNSFDWTIHCEEKGHDRTFVLMKQQIIFLKIIKNATNISNKQTIFF